MSGCCQIASIASAKGSLPIEDIASGHFAKRRAVHGGIGGTALAAATHKARATAHADAVSGHVLVPVARSISQGQADSQQQSDEQKHRSNLCGERFTERTNSIHCFTD